MKLEMEVTLNRDKLNQQLDEIKEIITEKTKDLDVDIEITFHLVRVDEGSCHYCKKIDKATPMSPRKKYRYCPMCGRRRK